MGGFQVFCDTMATRCVLDDVLLSYKHVLADVLPSTFIFHRGMLDAREGIGEVHATSDFAGIRTQPDHSTIDI